MIEIKLSQGEAGHGGILPAHKVSAEIAATLAACRCGASTASRRRGTRPSTHPWACCASSRACATPGGKPVGSSSASGILGVHGDRQGAAGPASRLTFVVVDGAEGGTGGAARVRGPHRYADARGAVVRAQRWWRGLRGAYGSAPAARSSAPSTSPACWRWRRLGQLGASFMFAVGCIQSQSCFTNRCFTGVAIPRTTAAAGAGAGNCAGSCGCDFPQHPACVGAQMLAATGPTVPSALCPAPPAAPRQRAARRAVLRAVSISRARRAAGDGGVADEPFRSAWLHARADSFERRRSLQPGRRCFHVQPTRARWPQARSQAPRRALAYPRANGSRLPARRCCQHCRAALDHFARARGKQARARAAKLTCDTSQVDRFTDINRSSMERSHRAAAPASSERFMNRRSPSSRGQLRWSKSPSCWSSSDCCSAPSWGAGSWSGEQPRQKRPTTSTTSRRRAFDYLDDHGPTGRRWSVEALQAHWRQLGRDHRRRQAM